MTQNANKIVNFSAKFEIKESNPISMKKGVKFPQGWHQVTPLLILCFFTISQYFLIKSEVTVVQGKLANLSGYILRGRA